MVNGQKVEIMCVRRRYYKVLYKISIRNLKIGTLKTKTINKNKKKSKKGKRMSRQILLILSGLNFFCYYLIYIFFWLGLMGWFY